MLTTEEKQKNFTTFEKFLTKIIGEDAIENIYDALNPDKIFSASYATTADTNLAYEGSLMKIALEICDIAVKINELLPEDRQADKKSIYKVGLLSQLSKTQMFVPNTDKWEIEKRGMIYKFETLSGALRVGERSILIAMNAGVKFTEEEFEAMSIVDKMKGEDNYSKYFSSPLTVVIKEALELINVKYGKRNTKE